MGVFLKRGKYFIDFYADGKRVRECVGRVSRRQAENALKSRMGDIVQGRYQLRRKVVCPFFSDFASEFMEYSRAHKSSRSSAADRTRLRGLLPFFGQYRLHAISKFLIEKYVHARRQSTSRYGRPPSNSTINRELGVLKHLFNKAIEWGKVDTNPVRGFRFLKEPPPQQRVLSDEEEQKLVDASAWHLKLAILLAINAGLRHGDVLALARRNIDLENDMLTIEHGKGDQRREVEINDRLKAALVEYLRDLKEEQLFFNRKTGKPFLTFRTAFNAAVRRSGIGYCRFHDLRHTFASRLVRRGVDLVTVKDLLGHAELETTLRYSHPGANARRRAVALLSDGHHMDTTAAPMISYKPSKLLKTNNVRL